MLGALIRQHREGKGLSQEKLAEYVGVSRQAVSKWEQGKAVPTQDNLRRIEQVLELEPDTLSIALELPEQDEEQRPKFFSRAAVWFAVGAAVIGVGAAFFAGRLSAPRSELRVGEEKPDSVTLTFHADKGSYEGRQVVLPLDEEGVARLEMPLAESGEWERSAANLEYYQWPDIIPLEKEAVTDFALYPPSGAANQVLAENWELLSDFLMDGNDHLGLARSTEEYDGATLWLLARNGAQADWTVLTRLYDENDLCWETGLDGERQWVTQVGNVMGYHCFRVTYNGDHSVLIAVVNGSPLIVFHLSCLAGFSDLDYDGELEIVCRNPESPYEIYDREPDGYYRYTLPAALKNLAVPEGMAFAFDPQQFAFGFEYYSSTKPHIEDSAPVYDRISSDGSLWRRNGNGNERAWGGAINGTAVTFLNANPDEFVGWTLDGQPMPTTRQQAQVLLQELEVLTGYRPERCYIWGGSSWLGVSLEQDYDHRTFFDATVRVPSHYESGWLQNCETSCGILYLSWQGEWSTWSPLSKENVPLPDHWDSMTEPERCRWWYDRSISFQYGAVVSVEPSQYEEFWRLNLENGDFIEISLDEDGFLTHMMGPYAEGTVH